MQVNRCTAACLLGLQHDVDDDGGVHESQNHISARSANSMASAVQKTSHTGTGNPTPKRHNRSLLHRNDNVSPQVAPLQLPETLLTCVDMVAGWVG